MVMKIWWCRLILICRETKYYVTTNEHWLLGLTKYAGDISLCWVTNASRKFVRLTGNSAVFTSLVNKMYQQGEGGSVGQAVTDSPSSCTRFVWSWDDWQQAGWRWGQYWGGGKEDTSISFCVHFTHAISCTLTHYIYILDDVNPVAF